MAERSSGTFSKVRGHGRFEVDLECQIRGEDLPGGAHYLRGRMRDLSLVGAFIDSAEAPAFGTKVVVVVKLPTVPKPVSLAGVVRWTRRQGGFGVQFATLDAHEAHALSRCVRELITRDRDSREHADSERGVA